MTSQTLLELLQSRTIVDCDTMDVEVPKTLGQYVDCTSNQAIAYFELQKPENEKIIQESIKLSKKLVSDYPDVSSEELAVEIAMVKLQLEISKHVSGFVHLQTNTYHSYDTSKAVEDARRIVQLFKRLDSAFDTARVCIKIPSTWEGLQACRVLQSTGTTTLATTLFTMEQVALAGEMGCHYIAPYVNELKVHFEPGFINHNKAQNLCVEAQRYYEAHKIKTQVLPASLTSADEIMQLAGVYHTTIAPDLLRRLSETSAHSLTTTSLFDNTHDVALALGPYPLLLLGDKEPEYRIAFTRSDKGEGERKLSQAINIFCDMQTKLEDMMVWKGKQILGT